MVKGRYEKVAIQFITQRKVKHSRSKHAMTMGVKRKEMGVNLLVLRRTPEPPGTPGRRLAPRWRVQFVNMYKYRRQSANMYKTLK